MPRAGKEGAATKQIGQVTEYVEKLLGLTVPSDRTIYLGPSNLAHMQTSHPADFAKYGTELINILAYPDYVGQNPTDGSIEYVKEFQVDGEFVKVAVRLAKLPGGQGQAPHWAADQLQGALQAGWYDWDEIPPTGETFDQPIPRQLAVKILMKALLPQARGDYAAQSPKIKDFSALDGRYYDAVLAAYASGVVHGDPDGSFRPKDTLSRAEACTLFQNAAKAQAGQPPVPSPPPAPSPAPSVQPRQGGDRRRGQVGRQPSATRDQQGLGIGPGQIFRSDSCRSPGAVTGDRPRIQHCLGRASGQVEQQGGAKQVGQALAGIPLKPR